MLANYIQMINIPSKPFKFELTFKSLSSLYLISYVFLLSLVLPVSLSAETIYSWKDQSGRMHYGSKPPQNSLEKKKISNNTYSKYSSKKLLKGYGIKKSNANKSRKTRSNIKSAQDPTNSRARIQNFEDTELPEATVTPQREIQPIKNLSANARANERIIKPKGNINSDINKPEFSKKTRTIRSDVQKNKVQNGLKNTIQNDIQKNITRNNILKDNSEFTTTASAENTKVSNIKVKSSKNETSPRHFGQGDEFSTAPSSLNKANKDISLKKNNIPSQTKVAAPKDKRRYSLKSESLNSKRDASSSIQNIPNKNAINQNNTQKESIKVGAKAPSTSFFGEKPNLKLVNKTNLDLTLFEPSIILDSHKQIVAVSSMVKNLSKNQSVKLKAYFQTTGEDGKPKFLKASGPEQIPPQTLGYYELNRDSLPIDRPNGEVLLVLSPK